MLFNKISYILFALVARTHSFKVVRADNASAPNLPDRQPFGFGAEVTGGGTPTDENTFIVDNMMDLRTALELTTPRTIYVKGEIMGTQVNETTTSNCQYYIDNSNVPGYNFTLYLMAMNETYMDAVEAAAAAAEEFDGQNATEYLNILKRQNGWRGTAQNVQKAQQSINCNGNVTLIGWDADTYLNGVGLLFNTKSNIIIRNLRISPPRDCFPAPETYPDSWNARYDAISFVTTSNAWLDGNILEDGPEFVAPEPYLWGWEVDRYDGLFDVEDGSDNITFSHNIVANHHKSLLWGGGEKEGDRDVGKMKFTVFGNHFVNSMSRNPLMRFGTFYLVNNVFSNYNNEEPLWDNTNTTSSKGTYATANGTYAPDFQYNMGIYNMSNVLVSGNYFDQTGVYPNDETRIFSFSDLETPDIPATLCSPPDLSAAELASLPGLDGFAKVSSQMNGQNVNLTENAIAKFAYELTQDDGFVEGGFVQDCVGFAGQSMPEAFASADDVFAYVTDNAGQVGKTAP
ncbi:unnamed protein product [Discula destructiva]